LQIPCQYLDFGYCCDTLEISVILMLLLTGLVEARKRCKQVRCSASSYTTSLKKVVVSSY
jgi:hypothetical protein